MVKLAQLIYSPTKYVALVILGIGGTLFFIFILLFLAIPLLIYRWFVLKIAARFFGPSDLRKGLNALGNGMAMEFKDKGDLVNSRFSAVGTFVMEGHVTYEEIYGQVEEKWILAKADNGELKYPEFQQYLAPWMGFMFFKQDLNFDLSNHIVLHTLDPKAGDKCSERFFDELNERLLNQPWKEGRSPWEIHLVQNYHDSSLLENCSETERNFSLFFVRFHHGLSDGRSILYALLEQLGGTALDSKDIPKPASVTAKFGLVRKLRYYFSLPVKMLHAMGIYLSLTLKTKSHFHCPDSRKSWRQVFCRGPLIPIKKIKLIKNHFGVSFGSVLDTALGTAMGKMLKIKMGNSMPESIAYGIAIPLPNHTKKMRNHASGIMYEMPVKPEMHALERLRKCERNVAQVKILPLVMLLSYAFRAVIGMPMPFPELLASNRFLETGVSSFPGTIDQVSWNKRKIVSTEGSAIPAPGVAGFAFFAVSYNGGVRLNATAEAAVLSKDELQQMFRWVQEELDTLFELAGEHVVGEENGRKLKQIDMV